MSSEIDFSQYRRQSEQEAEESEEEAFDLNQYRRKGAVEKTTRKAGRLAGQAGISLAEMATLPYSGSVIGAQMIQRNPLLDVTERKKKNEPKLAKELEHEQGGIGREFSKGLEQKLGEQREYEKQHQFIPEWVKKQNWDVGGLIEKAAEFGGIDMKPEDLSEHMIRWIGTIKDPRKLPELTKAGVDLFTKPQKFQALAKTLIPTGKEALRGLGGGAALEIAAENELGPIGAMAAAVIGDIGGALAPSVGKGVAKFAKAPIRTSKELAARAVVAGTRLSGAEKRAIQQQLIQDFRDAGIQADLGSITDSNVVKTIQARLAASGLVGKALDEFRQKLSNDLISGYKTLGNEIGESVSMTDQALSTAAKEQLETGRKADLNATRDIYNDIEKLAEAPQAVVYPDRLYSAVEKLEKRLAPGGVKSTEQKAVLKVLEDIKKDILEDGRIKPARIKDLMNNKFAINDIIDYETQGGAKQLLKGLNKEIDKTIQQYGRRSPEFLEKWNAANSRFAQHSRTFRNKNINDILKSQEPTTILNKMNTGEGINRIKKALGVTPEGERYFRQLARRKFESIIENNVVDGATNQLKFGKFANLLDKGKNREIIRHLLGDDSYARLVRLQKASGRLAESAQKFFNSSKTGSSLTDQAIITKGVMDIVSAIGGNPWPLMKTLGIGSSVRLVSRLITDPVFLKAVEDGMLAGSRGDIKGLQNAFNSLYGGVFGLKEEAEALQHTKLSPEEMKQAAQSRGMRKGAGKAEEIKPQGPTTEEQQLAPEFGERVFEKNPKYKNPWDEESLKELKEKPNYLRESDLEHSKKPTRDLTPDETKLDKNEWNKYFDPDKYDSFYSTAKSEPLYMKNKKGEEKYITSRGDQIGNLGDFIKGQKLREFLKDVLDIPVYKMDKYETAWGGYVGEQYSPKAQRMIKPFFVINNRISPQAIFESLAHEGYHALQDLKGTLLARTRKDIPYFFQMHERGARKFAQWATKDVQKARVATQKAEKFSENIPKGSSSSAAKEFWKQYKYFRKNGNSHSKALINAQNNMGGYKPPTF